MKRFNIILLGVSAVLSSSVMAYIPDRCDWQDCDALARGESSSPIPIIISLIILGLIVFSSKK